MSWDVSLYKFSRIYESLDQIPEDEQAHSLGSLRAVQDAVSSVFPATDWSDPIWGIFDSEFGLIEFNVGKDAPVTSLALHVRASESIVPGILQLCALLSCQAIDLTDSFFLDQSEHPEQGLNQWQAYRDHALQNGKV